VLRPADAEETAVAWRIALERLDGPTVIALTRQNLPVFVKEDPEWAWTMALGAYVVKNSSEGPETIVVASGSEVSLALKALELVDKAGSCSSIRLVSMPSREAFYAAPAPVREAIIPSTARVIVVEAGVSMGWERIAKPADILSIDRFGESGPGDEVAAHFGFTAERLAALIKG